MTQNEEIRSLLLREIENARAKQRERDDHGWDISPYRDLKILQIDSRGLVGENFVVAALAAVGKEVKHHDRTDREQEKQWDIFCDGIRLEVKIATMGRVSPTFQHENLDKNRAFDGIIFIDVAPDAVYVSFVPKFLVPWSEIHRRKDSTYYKWDFRRADLEENGRRVETLEDFRRGYEAMLAEIRRHRAERGPVEDI